jgi:hypothetical protein
MNVLIIPDVYTVGPQITAPSPPPVDVEHVLIVRVILVAVEAADILLRVSNEILAIEGSIAFASRYNAPIFVTKTPVSDVVPLGTTE